MAKKKVFAVELISTTVQTKLVYAESKEDALEIAYETDWDGKEEILDTETKARLAIKSGDEKEGTYPDFFDSNYVEFKNDNGDFDYCRYNELEK